jgi:hypothetical protein
MIPFDWRGGPAVRSRPTRGRAGHGLRRGPCPGRRVAATLWPRRRHGHTAIRERSGPFLWKSTDGRPFADRASVLWSTLESRGRVRGSARTFGAAIRDIGDMNGLTGARRAGASRWLSPRVLVRSTNGTSGRYMTPCAAGSARDLRRSWQRRCSFDQRNLRTKVGPWTAIWDRTRRRGIADSCTGPSTSRASGSSGSHPIAARPGPVVPPQFRSASLTV